MGWASSEKHQIFTIQQTTIGSNLGRAKKPDPSPRSDPGSCTALPPNWGHDKYVNENETSNCQKGKRKTILQKLVSQNWKWKLTYPAPVDLVARWQLFE